MSRLVPCSSCRRHLRRTEAVCPFCAAPNPADATEQRPVRSPGAKRAVLFAMGVSVAASACEADTNTIAIYGAPVAPQGGAAGSGGTGGTAGTAGNSTAGGSGGSAGTLGSAGSDSASSDAGNGDAGDGDSGDGDASP